MSITVPVFSNLPNSATQTESQYNVAWNESLGTFNAYGAALNALGAQVEQYALDAASAVAALTNAKWVAGTFADGDVRWSPTDYQDYRNKGAGTRNTDPALDPTNWVPRIRTGNGGADATSSAVDITLTSSNGRLQIIAMTAASRKVTLPAASTLTKGAPVFVLKNAGTYRFSVHKNGGGFLCYIQPGQVIALHCSDTGSAAGVWQVSGQDVDEIYTGNTDEVLTAVNVSYIAVAMTSATQAICAFRNGSTTFLNAVVINYGSASGIPAQVVGHTAKYISIAAQTNSQVTICYRKDTGETHAVVLDIDSATTFVAGVAKKIDASATGTGTSICAQSTTQLLAFYQPLSGDQLQMRVLDISSSSVLESAAVNIGEAGTSGVNIKSAAINSVKSCVAWRAAADAAIVIKFVSITGSTPAASGSSLALTVVGGAIPTGMFAFVLMNSSRAIVVQSIDRAFGGAMLALIDVSGSSPVLLMRKILHIDTLADAQIAGCRLDSNTAKIIFGGIHGGVGIGGFIVIITADDNIIISRISNVLGATIDNASGYFDCVALDANHVMLAGRKESAYLAAKTLELPI